jgi:hypothetical protein
MIALFSPGRRKPRFRIFPGFGFPWVLAVGAVALPENAVYLLAGERRRTRTYLVS